jgi:probable rRNA maturation factor
MTDFDVNSEVIESLLKGIDREGNSFEEVSVALVDDESMADLHETYYGETGTTDVLTFNYDDRTLEIVINPYQHRRQADDAGNTLPEETAENLIHGFLHGLGFDHTNDDGEHLEEQKRLMNELEQDFSKIIQPLETTF